MFSYRRNVVASVVFVVLSTAIASPYAYRAWCSHRRNELAKQCRAARSSLRWDDLQVLADRWTGWDSLNGEAWMFRGQAASGRADWSAAASHFWRVPDSDSHAIPAMIEVSKLAFTRLNDPLKGIDACHRILQIDPRAVGAHTQLIGFYATTLQREKLLQQIHAAIHAKSEPREAYVYYFLLYTFRSMDAVELNERWLKEAPESELFLVARVLQLPDPKTESPETPIDVPAGGFSRSLTERSKLEQVDELLNRFPHNLELIAYKAEDRFAAGDVRGAAALLSQAPDAAGNDNRFWRFKGWLHESNGELEKATEAYHRALELHSVDWSTMNRLAVVERRQRNVAEVERLTKLVEQANEIRRTLRKLKSVEMVTPAILVDLAKLYDKCGDREIGPALERRLGLGGRTAGPETR